MMSFERHSNNPFSLNRFFKGNPPFAVGEGLYTAYLMRQNKFNEQRKMYFRLPSISCAADNRITGEANLTSGSISAHDNAFSERSVENAMCLQRYESIGCVQVHGEHEL